MSTWSSRLRKVIFDLILTRMNGMISGGRSLRGEVQVHPRLPRVARAFLDGCYAAIEADSLDHLESRLNSFEADLRVFGFEGAGMGLTLLDQLTPWNRNRWLSLLRGRGAPYAEVLHVGAGIALAQLNRPVERHLSQPDPFLRWLVVDGYGFFEGMMHWQRYIDQQAEPEQFSGYWRCAFDHGVGRSLWIVENCDVVKIAATIASFSPSRQADLWSGTGMVGVNAGGMDRADSESLRAAAGPYRAQLAQGAAFAAWSRRRMGNLTANVELACDALCGQSAAQAADLVEAALHNLPPDRDEPAYGVWRKRVQTRFVDQAATA